MGGDEAQAAPGADAGDVAHAGVVQPVVHADRAGPEEVHDGRAARAAAPVGAGVLAGLMFAGNGLLARRELVPLQSAQELLARRFFLAGYAEAFFTVGVILPLARLRAVLCERREPAGAAGVGGHPVGRGNRHRQ